MTFLHIPIKTHDTCLTHFGARYYNLGDTGEGKTSSNKKHGGRQRGRWVVVRVHPHG